MLMRRIDEVTSELSGLQAVACCATCFLNKGSRWAGVTCAPLMRQMAIEAIYRRPNTSKTAPRTQDYSYLLRGLRHTRPKSSVGHWTSLTFPMARGFVYLAAVVDWFSAACWLEVNRITHGCGFCIEALEEALSNYGKPEIFNTYQGSQFTSEAFTGRLRKKASRSAWMARAGGATNVFVERLCVR